MPVLRQGFAALRALLVLTLLLGVGYPLAVTGAALALPDQAKGSLVRDQGAVVGSSLLGQRFEGAQWFAPRPSTTDYEGSASGGSNYGRNNPDQLAAIASRTEVLRKQNPDAVGAPPADAVTASGSGLDPDISVAYALWQVPRVAKARGLAPAVLEQLVRSNVTGPTLGYLGERRVNVLRLNLALKHAAPNGDGR